jgi:4,5-DOPA dioxygenase extradiol
MQRSQFLKIMATTPFAAAAAMQLREFEQQASAEFAASDPMPLLFIGHGHPMNALWDNDFTRSLTQLGQKTQKPNAIMVVSAHWFTRGTYVSVNPKPQTIYDFGGFDDRLFQIKYEPAGHPDLAREAIRSVADTEFKIEEHDTMGLDHGTWTVLKYLFPEADVPVFQMSIDATRPPQYHFELAKALRKMREKGVLIIGSGNIVHNLGMLDWRDLDAPPHDWAIEFDTQVRQRLEDRRFGELVDYQALGKAAMLSVPTNDHYLPMLYTLGLAAEKDALTYTFEGFQFAGVGMRCFQFG